MKFGARWWILLIAVVCACVAVAVLGPDLIFRKQRLNGLLIDLELGAPDPSRYGQLRDAFTKRLNQEVPFLEHLEITLDYEHFSTLQHGRFQHGKPDFIILSPQSTPWTLYGKDAADELKSLKALLKDLILRDNVPVLGVCGGHQFMALAFGGMVGFIDPRFSGASPERYPPEAVSERGLVWLETLTDDPIFQGITAHPGRFQAVESHYEEVKSVPEPFVNLARSEMSEVQLIRMPGRTVYGVAFHPERGWNGTEDPATGSHDGKLILANFLRMVARH